MTIVPTLFELQNKFKDLQAIIFDMDGTLLDSEVLHAKALSVLLGDTQKYNVDDLLSKFKGKAEPDVVTLLIEMGILNEDVKLESFIIQKNLIFQHFLSDVIVKESLILPELKNLIDEARKINLKLAVVTASERSTTELFLKGLDLFHLFDHVITRDDTEKSKPDPLPYLHSFEKLQITPAQALIFEDSDTGHCAAVASGGNVIRVSWYE